MGKEQPPALDFQLLPSTVLLDRFCPAHSCSQGADLGISYLLGVSPLFAQLLSELTHH